MKNSSLKKLLDKFSGDIYFDELHRIAYATDASIYRQLPKLVCYPRNKSDIKHLLEFAIETKNTIISRTAGTSLAGQVVGNGIIMDLSRYFNNILELNLSQRYVVVEPGLVLDVLNNHLKSFKLFFGPETSTSNRCMIGGMIGNNSCGARSGIYGSVRDHLLEVDVILSDGSEATFGDIEKETFEQKCKLPNLEGKIYRCIRNILTIAENQQKIMQFYPDWQVNRRNTGYALDILLQSDLFGYGTKKFNLAKLIAGSEGTLAIVTSAKLNLVDIPPSNVILLCVHFNSLQEALMTNIEILNFNPTAVELLDGKILELTKNNLSQQKNRFFIKGDPAALLIIEFARDNHEDLCRTIVQCIDALRSKNFGYEHVIIDGEDIKKVWDLRKAGLGILTSDASDLKPITFTEDIAVNPKLLPSFVQEVEFLFSRYQIKCVFYAHVATGEIHLKPILNLKLPEHVSLMKKLAHEMVLLVKKYRGSLSGEHGDGFLRSEFLPEFYGTDVYNLFREVKKTFDPDNLLNRGKIVDSPPMHVNLRTNGASPNFNFNTFLKFRIEGDILHAVERCNGSADCRRPPQIAYGMCPTYMATMNEIDTTRARANLLREFLSFSKKPNPFHHKELFDVLKHCIMCKACKAECPSGIDITAYKMEFLYQWYKKYPPDLRTIFIANIHRILHIASLFPSLYNYVVSQNVFFSILKNILKIAQQRSFPLLHKTTLRKLLKKNLARCNVSVRNPKGKVVLFIDEFSNFYDVDVGFDCAELLWKLGYQVIFYDHSASGRSYLTKGFLKQAKKLAKKNITFFSDIVDEDCPLVGIEPSAILCFRDEYLHLCDDSDLDKAMRLAQNTMLLEEFFVKEVKKGNITQDNFSSEPMKMIIHGHCHQKALVGNELLLQMMRFPKGNEVIELKTGCCGMAGSFGYEKEHYDISMKIGQLHLFPQIKSYGSDVYIIAPGTSCRQQIKDLTDRQVMHPAQLLVQKLGKALS